MTEYINKKTKAVIESDLAISGGDWEVFEPKQNQVEPTVPELKSMLIEMGVEFNPKAKKDELLVLYEEHKE